MKNLISFYTVWLNEESRKILFLPTCRVSVSNSYTFILYVPSVIYNGKVQSRFKLGNIDHACCELCYRIFGIWIVVNYEQKVLWTWIETLFVVSNMNFLGLLGFKKKLPDCLNRASAKIFDTMTSLRSFEQVEGIKMSLLVQTVLET